MPYLFPIIYAIWFLSEVVLNRIRRSSEKDQQNADQNSLSLIWIVMISSIAIATYISASFYFPLSAAYTRTLAYTGLALMVIGIVLRFAIVKSLGQFFTVTVTIRENHQLQKAGFYKFVRHPSYAASLLTSFGFGLSLNNWVSLLLVMVPTLAAFANRIRVEEKVLVAHFGSEYTQYQQVTKRLIPFVY